MPGRPVLRKLGLDIAAKGDPEHDPHGEAYIWDLIVSGETLDKIAAPFGISKGTLLAWLNQGGKQGPRWQAYQEARRLSAFVKEELAGQVLADLKDDVTLTAPRVTLAMAKSKHLQWQAEKWNREEFGPPAAAPLLQLNFGTVHLDALKSAGGPVELAAPAAVSLPAPRVVEADYEIYPAQGSPEDTVGVLIASEHEGSADRVDACAGSGIEALL